MLTGAVIGQCLPRHRHQEFLKFLRRIGEQTPKELQIHMMLDNYATHKHAKVNAWLAKHPRFHLHCAPTSSSWLNLVERWFREITDMAFPHLSRGFPVNLESAHWFPLSPTRSVAMATSSMVVNGWAGL